MPPFPLKRGILPILSFLLLVGGCSLPKVVVLSDPLTSQEHLQLGTIYESEGKLDMALREYEKALAKDRRNPRILFAIGNIYLLREDLNRAESYYKKAISIDPSWPPPYNNLAWMYVNRGELDRAEELITQAISLNPPNPSPYYDTLGLLYMEKGDYRKAEKAFLKALDGAGESERREIEKRLKETRKALRKIVPGGIRP